MEYWWNIPTSQSLPRRLAHSPQGPRVPGSQGPSQPTLIPCFPATMVPLVQCARPMFITHERRPNSAADHRFNFFPPLQLQLLRVCAPSLLRQYGAYRVGGLGLTKFGGLVS